MTNRPPRSEGPARDSLITTRQQAGRRTTRILLVEDDPGDALIVEELLDGFPGFDLTWVTTLTEARRRLHDGYTCVLLDLGLPDATGVGIVQQVLADVPRAAVLVLTGEDDEARAVQAVASGAQDYLVKGQVDSELLMRSVRYAVERKRAEESMQALAAARLQTEENARLERGLLAQPLLRDGSVTSAMHYRPGREQAVLGGDFFDLVETTDGTVHVLIGDVCGHGADEAAIGVCLRAAWRALVLADIPPQRVLATLDEVLVAERASDELFATVCVVTIDRDRRSASLILAGHPAPLFLDQDDVRPLAAEPGPALGILPGLTWPVHRLDLGSDWALLLYTDGIIEGHVGEGPARLSEDGLATIARAERKAAATDRELLDVLLLRAEDLNGGPLTDDVALLLVRRAEAGGR